MTDQETNGRTSQRKVRPLCGNCQPTTAETWCEQCGINYCSACCDRVHKENTFDSHFTISIDEKMSNSLSCEIHPNRKYEYWCLNCETIICPECRTFKHQNHKYELISNVSENMKQEINSSFKKIQLSLEETVKKTKERIDKWSQPSVAEKTIREKATEVFASLHTMINEYEKTLIGKLDIIEKKNQEYIKEFQNQLDQQQKHIDEQKKLFASINSNDNQKMRLKFQNNLNKNLYQILEQLDKIEGPIKIHYHIEGLNKLKATIAKNLKKTVTIDTREKKIPFIEASSLKPLICGGTHCSICGLCFDWYHDDGWKRRDTGKCCGNVRCFFVQQNNRHRYVYHAVSIDGDDDHTDTLCVCKKTSENVQ